MAHAPADGYTLALGTVGTHSINGALHSKMPYDMVKDFVPVMLIATTPNVLVVNPDVPAKCLPRQPWSARFPRRRKPIPPNRSGSWSVFPAAACPDVGSTRLHVSIGGDTPRVFGTMTHEISELVGWLQAQDTFCGVRGDRRLLALPVRGTGGRGHRGAGGQRPAGGNLPGRKTDMADCQWLATLHAHGLLHSGFVPPAPIRRLQDYLRLRQDHITMAASNVQHMQKALERMNVKFQTVISDLTGASGLKFIQSILDGHRDPAYLLAQCDVQIRKRKGDRVKESLRGIWREEHLFALRQAFECWQFYQQQIADCDHAIERVLRELGGPPRDPHEDSPAKPGGPHMPKIDGLHRMLLQLCANCDPTRLPGMADYSLLLLGEVGTDLTRWPSEKHFTAWTGLTPGAHQSGKRNG